MQEVTITFKDGNPTIEVNGIKGPDCTKATEALEAALGKTIARTVTQEFHEPAKEDHLHVS